jgi:glycosyltransferase involved in cell wall biosynthesis
MTHTDVLIVNLEAYGKGGLGTLAYHIHETLLKGAISSALIASGNPRNLPNVFVLGENDYTDVPQLVLGLEAKHRLVIGRNELAELSRHLNDLILMTGGTAYFQSWLEAHPEKTTLDFLRLSKRPRVRASSRLRRERLAVEKAIKILSAPGLNAQILRKVYPGWAHKVFEVPQVFRRLRPGRTWHSREIDLIAVAQWKDRGVDRDVKGYRLLADIVSRLKSRRLRTVVVGDAPFPLEGVLHTGWVDHEKAVSLMGNAKVFVSPSRNECYGQALVEAFQVGCNVVLSPNVEPHGFCHPDLVAQYQVKSFAEKIDKALTREFPGKPLPSPKDSLHLLMSALHGEGHHLGSH